MLCNVALTGTIVERDCMCRRPRVAPQIYFEKKKHSYQGAAGEEDEELRQSMFVKVAAYDTKRDRMCMEKKKLTFCFAVL